MFCGCIDITIPYWNIILHMKAPARYNLLYIIRFCLFVPKRNCSLNFFFIDESWGKLMHGLHCMFQFVPASIMISDKPLCSFYCCQIRIIVVVVVIIVKYQPPHLSLPAITWGEGLSATNKCLSVISTVLVMREDCDSVDKIKSVLIMVTYSWSLFISVYQMTRNMLPFLRFYFVRFDKIYI